MMEIIILKNLPENSGRLLKKYPVKHLNSLLKKRYIVWAPNIQVIWNLQIPLGAQEVQQVCALSHKHYSSPCGSLLPPSLPVCVLGEESLRAPSANMAAGLLSQSQFKDILLLAGLVFVVCFLI